MLFTQRFVLFWCQNLIQCLQVLGSMGRLYMLYKILCYMDLYCNRSATCVYIPSSLQYKTHFNRQLNCWLLRCSWSIACRRCSNYIFILHMTLGFNVLHKNNCKPRRETFQFWDLVRLILEILRYIDISLFSLFRTFNELHKPSDLYARCQELSESLSEDLKDEALLVSGPGTDHMIVGGEEELEPPCDLQLWPYPWHWH